MICDNCKINNATLNYKQIVNGQKLEYNLCSNCAKKFEKDLLFSNMFKDFFISFENNNFNSSKNILKCEKCGNTLNNIKNTGKMGCDNCYKVFKNNIFPIIKNFQFDNVHIGKGTKYNKENKIQNELKDLKLKLKQAIELENYELAITLRDKIKELEGGI